MAIALAVAPAAGQETAPAQTRWNVLMIVLDDMNARATKLGGAVPSVTPNIDRLAAEGVSFRYAYAPAAACNPSRAAVLSGVRPSTSGIYHNDDRWKDAIGDAATLPQHLRAHGYKTFATGKLFHNGAPGHLEGMGDFWDDYAVIRPVKPRAVRDVSIPHAKISWTVVRNDDEAKMADARRARWVEHKLAGSLPEPFFLAVGFVRPHLPFVAPEHYFDAISLDDVHLPEAGSESAAPGPRRAAEHEAIVEAGLWKEAIRAYLASAAFADAQVGRVLAALRASAHADDTLVVLWSDHGLFLGEQQVWRKGTLSEETTRVPYIFALPGTSSAKGPSDATVDLMSLYPTLLELTRVPPPEHTLEGMSIARLLENPAAPWTGAALTTQGHGNHAVRRGRWRLVVEEGEPDVLYDVTEPGDGPTPTNLAGRDEHRALVAELRALLPKK